jgi:hypothetical protein
MTGDILDLATGRFFALYTLYFLVYLQQCYETSKETGHYYKKQIFQSRDPHSIIVVSKMSIVRPRPLSCGSGTQINGLLGSARYAAGAISDQPAPPACCQEAVGSVESNAAA